MLGTEQKFDSDTMDEDYKHVLSYRTHQTNSEQQQLVVFHQ